jgi:hypothetical protein
VGGKASVCYEYSVMRHDPAVFLPLRDSIEGMGVTQYKFFSLVDVPYVERRILSGFFKNQFLRLHRLAERKREAARKRTGIIFPTAISRTLLILRGRRLLFTVTSKKTGEEQAE